MSKCIALSPSWLIDFHPRYLTRKAKVSYIPIIAATFPRLVLAITIIVVSIVAAKLLFTSCAVRFRTYK